MQRSVTSYLLHNLGVLRAERLPAIVVQDLLERDVLESDQRRLQHVEAGLIGEGEHRSSLNAWLGRTFIRSVHYTMSMHDGSSTNQQLKLEHYH
jgi:hypothetical protein